MTESLSDAQIQYQLLISHHLVFIPFAILLYDYALTFDQEVTRYWSTKLSWGTLLFYTNRYSALFGTIPVFTEYLLTTIGADPHRVKVCDGLRAYHEYFALLSQVLTAAILITRTFALYERDKRVLALMLIVTLAAFISALRLILVGTDSGTLSPLLQTIGCPSATLQSTNLRQAAAWSGLLVFDVMIFSLTVYKSFKYGARGGTLFGLLFRDGALYFGIMIVSNACNIGTYILSGPLMSGSATTLTNTLSSVMISRLMLNLRDPSIRLTLRNRTTRASTTQDSPAITTLRMTPYMGTDIALDSVWYERSHRSLDDEEDNVYNAPDDRRFR
ncbi:hypothetical protein B0H17DRAFT_1072332 [Mycena rosella]|uniref:DUF6533 domain-containing protein n=1 Tax=Mycena rosella TaxID=1033263 RepID=A0AAD7GF77_MYCRO|nr:hypothetical protein B0H17DRAFT_1072332 [Mycena rosella]